MNNILCDFRNVDSNTKIRLVKAYCMTLYGAELWDLSSDHIDSICITWRRGIKKIWRLPNTTHSSLLPGLCKTIPLIDLLYKRSLKLVYRCLNSRSFVVNFIASHSILFCRMNSIIGRNELGCCQRYNTQIESVVTCHFDIKNIDRTASTASDDVCNQVARLNELIQCTDGMLWLSDVSFTSYDIEQLIYLLCTS